MLIQYYVRDSTTFVSVDSQFDLLSVRNSTEPDVFHPSKSRGELLGQTQQNAGIGADKVKFESGPFELQEEFRILVIGND